MPISGGPSSKLGNRYELQWTVRKMVDVVLGRYDHIRLEPPGEDAIEFRCQGRGRAEVHQVKRTKSSRGHWTIQDLRTVLDAFGAMLDEDADLTCYFVSEQDAAILREISDRARSALDGAEFLGSFLTSQATFDGWQKIRERWDTSDESTFERLRRIYVVPEGEEPLTQNTETILELMFDADSRVSRAVMVNLALESVHRVLTAEIILEHLRCAGIRARPRPAASSFVVASTAPPSRGIRRADELACVRSAFDQGRRTIVVTGLSGIGKTTLVTQICNDWPGPVCWIDCALLSSPREAIGTIAEFIESFNAELAARYFSGVQRPIKSLAVLAGRVFSQHQCLVVWDGVDHEIQPDFADMIVAIAATLGNGAQVVTSQTSELAVDPDHMTHIRVDRLPRDAVRNLLLDAYPDARLRDLERADEVTHGHPYLVQLLAGSASKVDLRTAIEATRGATHSSAAFLSQLLEELDEQQRSFLRNVAFLGVPFSAHDVSQLGGSREELLDLAARNLIIRVSSEKYHVHQMIADWVTQSINPHEVRQLHERIALYLRGLEKPSWSELRALLDHALAASLPTLARDAGQALLAFAMDKGLWSLARDSASGLVRVLDREDAFFPYFVLGKYDRLSGDLELALTHFTQAEEASRSSEEQDRARFERASVLCGLERPDEAETIYRALMQSGDAEMRIGATTSLALGVISRRGHTNEAFEVLHEAARSAKTAGLARLEAEAYQATAEVLIDEERWEEARDALRRAHKLRHTKDLGKSDVYGWYFLFYMALRTEDALGNAQGAASAAHCLWRFAVISNNFSWEAEAAYTLCKYERNPAEGELVAAVERLANAGRNPFLPTELRRKALESLTICTWTLGEYDRAIEALIETQAIAAEYGLSAPRFMHLRAESKNQEPVCQVGGVYVLLIPVDEPEEFVLEVVARVIQRRPELAQYVNVMKAARERVDQSED